MDKIWEKFVRIAEDNDGVIRTSQVEAAGISRPMLKKYMDLGKLERIRKGVMSRVMRKIDFGIWQKSITGGGLTALWLLFSRQGAKGQGRRYAARLALDAL